MQRVIVFGLGVMVDSVLGIIFASLGAAYVLAKLGDVTPPLADWFTSGDAMWMLGATVVVAVLLNIPREIRNWLESE